MPHRDDLARQPPAGARPGPGPGRMAIISASVGAGHGGAVAGHADQLAAAGLLMDRHDCLDLLPALNKAASRPPPRDA